MATSQEQLEFTTRHSFSYRDGANNKYHLKDSLENDNSLANLLKEKLHELYKLKESIKSLTHHFTNEEIEEFKNLFDRLDTNKSKKISKTEFWNFYISVVKLNRTIKLFDTSIDLSDKEGIIRLKEEAQAEEAQEKKKKIRKNLRKY